ncbi:hypothetical protein MKEN_01294900 [Mycena kentingensis (nom. inval.)]|nr:hypothetical protein MKEN_01294900 [Mycena kentingensis (nom. inval.)]
MTPPALKPIAPFLQRADELRSQDPIVAYWCTYYAAQVGISLKAKDSASRDYLFELLGNLEKMKEQIGPSDALDTESVSAAYVENFALRVFAMADNEDRSGAGNRSTAKKFLAAANFLEVLKTFPKTEISENTEEKIRYAKWKAADIAKAYREGRKPTPGPAASDAGIDAELLQLQRANGPSSVESNAIGTVQAPSLSESPPKHNPHISPDVIADANRQFSAQTPPRDSNDSQLKPGSWGGQGQATPGSWSTAATPGTGATTPFELDAPSSPSTSKGKSRESSEGTEHGILLAPDVDLGLDNKKFVRFAGPSPPVSPQYPNSPPNAWHETASLPPGFVPDPTTFHPSAPPLPEAQYPSAPSAPHVPVVPPPPNYVIPPTLVSPPPPPPAAVEVELTPMVIAKAQKHCRFAISALDYEDAAQARKELRAALAVLGG